MAAARIICPAESRDTVTVPIQSKDRHPDIGHGLPKQTLASQQEHIRRQGAYIESMSHYLKLLDNKYYQAEHEKHELKNQCTAHKANEESFMTERETHKLLFRQHEKELNIYRKLIDTLIKNDPSVAFEVASGQMIEQNAWREAVIHDFKKQIAQLTKRNEAVESRLKEKEAETRRVSGENAYLRSLLSGRRDLVPSATLQKETTGSVRSEGGNNDVAHGLPDSQKGPLHS